MNRREKAVRSRLSPTFTSKSLQSSELDPASISTLLTDLELPVIIPTQLLEFQIVHCYAAGGLMDHVVVKIELVRFPIQELM